MSVKRAAHDRGVHEIGEAEILRAIVLQECLGFDGLARSRSPEHRGDDRSDERAAPDEPGVPEARGIEAERERLDRGTSVGQAFQRTFADIEYAAFDRQVASEVREPADAHAAYGGAGFRN